MDYVSQEEAFLSELELSGRGKNTLKNYRTDLKCFREFLIDGRGQIDVSDIHGQRTLEYSHHLDRKYPSYNSRRRRLQAVRLFCDYLVTKGILPANPMKGIAPSPKVLATPLGASATQLSAMLEAISTPTEHILNEKIRARNLALIAIILGAGAKTSEIEKLKAGSFFEGRLMITRDSGPISIPLPTEANHCVADYIQLLELEHEDVLLFNCNARSILKGRLSARGMELIFQKTGSGVTPRQLRLSAIHRWLQTGISQDTVREWMGVRPDFSFSAYLQAQRDHQHSCDPTLVELLKC